jgi:phosphate transport system substrate-binding protein
MKKIFSICLVLVLILSALTGCGGSKTSSSINVVSREDGSGTRAAFVELMGIMQDDVDNTTDLAEITNSTSVMMTTVAGNPNAIGYVSLGSLNDSVKVVKIDGVEATVQNIKDKSYKVSRPFNIATKNGLSELAQDFVDYILSSEGQKIIEENGYISIGEGKSYGSSGKSGKITIAGSTSVAPVMEIIAEAYKVINPEVTIEIQQTGSSAGMTSTIEGVCDIGMASRELKGSELSGGLTATTIAMDGIAVIVNNKNAVESLTSEQVKSILLVVLQAGRILRLKLIGRRA